MAWACLIAAGLFEIGWPLGLKLGWTDDGIKPWPLAGSIACMALSGILLLIAQRFIPMGTAYAVWVGIGATLTVAFGMATGDESVGLVKVLLLCGLIGCIVGLKLVH